MWNEAENLQNGDFHLAEIPDFGMKYLENHLVHWGQWGLMFLHFFRSFIWAKVIFCVELPFKTFDFQSLNGSVVTVKKSQLSVNILKTCI